MTDAADELHQLTRSPSEGIPLRACIALLDHGLKAVVLADPEDHIRSLEQKMTHEKVIPPLGEPRSTSE